jgi:acetolactate synthase I/II/III large subunit
MERLKTKEKVRTTDYLLKQLEKLNVKHVFGVTGGAISTQMDAFSRSDIKFIGVQHEQAAAMAADAYSRLNGYGVCMATSGPGGTNTTTGIACSWFDSVPTLTITGQVSTFDLKTNDVRQRGFQEINMCDVMRPVTKYTKLITKPEELPDELEKAVRISLEGRQGPVHLDIPMDVQQAEIEPRSLNFFPEKEFVQVDVAKVTEMLSEAERPVLIVGNGCRHCIPELTELADRLSIPLLPSWGMLDFSHDNRVEQFGVYGNRGANYTAQNADLILAIGTRLDTRMTGSNPKQFAREAKKIIVDIDRAELEKGVVTPDVPIQADAKDFIVSMLNSGFRMARPEWLSKSKEWRDRYPIEAPDTEMINQYGFIKVLSEECNASVIIPDCSSNMAMMYQMFKPKIIIPDTGSGMAHMYQGFKTEKGQRLFTAMGNSPMGYSLPAAIGAGILGYDTVATIGDGGVQMNIQEFQTIKNYDIPLKLFIFSNQGYGLIRQFQDLYLGGRHVNTEEGVPDFARVAEAYGLETMTISEPSKMREQIREALGKRQVIVNVIMDPQTVVVPRAIFGKPIEEQHPYLPDSEVEANLFIKRWKP